jgi:hypothetical protein
MPRASISFLTPRNVKVMPHVTAQASNGGVCQRGAQRRVARARNYDFGSSREHLFDSLERDLQIAEV